jgi:hypothetical protein
MNQEPAGTNQHQSDRGVPASVSPGHLRALSEVLGASRKPPARLSLADVQEAVQASPALAGLSAATPALIYRGLRHLQLINDEDEPTQVYLQLLAGNTDADWKDFIDAHFDYLLHDEVSLLDLDATDLRQRLADAHPDTGASTLAAAGRLIRGMMTRSFEQQAGSAAQETAAAAPAAAPAAPAAPARRKATQTVTTRTARTATPRPPAATSAATPQPAAETAERTSAEVAEKPRPEPEPAAVTRRAPRARAKAAAPAPASDIPLTGSITLPLGGSNSATLSWSLSTFDAKSVQVVTSQLDIAARFIAALKK